MTPRSEVSTKDVMAALRKKYAGADERAWSGGFYLEECGINGGGAQTRCDALYAGFTSASGRLLIGHEVKVSRADWLTELKTIGKADFWHDNCHRWFIVTVAGVVGDYELPEGWGLMLLQGGRLVTKVQPQTRDITPSWNALRSMLSRAETLRAASVQNALADARQKVDRQMREMQTELDAARRVAGGNTATQVKIQQIVAKLVERTWVYRDVDVDTVVEAVADQAGLEKASASLRRHLESVIEQTQHIALEIRSAYGPLRQLLEEMDHGPAVTG